MISISNSVVLQYRCQGKTQLLLGKPSPCNPAAETAIQPLIGCSESLLSHAPSSPEECLFTDTGMTIESCYRAMYEHTNNEHKSFQQFDYSSSSPPYMLRSCIIRYMLRQD